MKWYMTWAVVLSFVLPFLAACGSTPTQVQGVGEQPTPPPGMEFQREIWPTPYPVAPGADGKYISNKGAGQDLHIYDITGIVQAKPEDNVTYRFESRISGSSGRYGGYTSGYANGGTNGKGIIRFLITDVKITDPYEGHREKESTGYEPLVEAGDVVPLKTVDAGAMILAAGDRVTFRCRIDSDFSVAVAEQENPTTASITQELDFCRIYPPKIQGPLMFDPATGQVTGTSELTHTNVVTP
jgi:hypothetical protein